MSQVVYKSEDKGALQIRRAASSRHAAPRRRKPCNPRQAPVAQPTERRLKACKRKFSASVLNFRSPPLADIPASRLTANSRAESFGRIQCNMNGSRCFFSARRIVRNLQERWTQGRQFDDVMHMVEHSDLAIGCCDKMARLT